MALKGNLETFLLTSILQLLHSDRKTGALHLKKGKDEVYVIMNEGAIVYAMSSRKEARLSNFLIAKGVISLEQLQECLDEGKEKKLALGRVLVDKGFISADTLQLYIRKQVEEILYSLFLWETGEFEYKDARLDLSGMVATQLDITRLMLEASRRIDEMSIFKKRIPNNQVVFRVVEEVRRQGEFNLQPQEKEIIKLIDGKHTVEEIIDNSGKDSYHIYKTLYSLISSGLIEKMEPVEKKLELKGKVNEPETSDSKAMKPISDEDFTALITGYNNILQIISRELEPEIGKETFVMMEECKPGALPGQKELLNNFHPHNPLPNNIFAIRQNLEALQDIRNERVFLIESFNRFILNVLDRIPDILGISHTQKVLSEVQGVLPFITRYMEGLHIKSNIVADMEKITAKVERELLDREKGKQKSGRLLSIFKKGGNNS